MSLALESPASAEATAPRRLFSAYGVELEYALVERLGLDVLPAADWLLARAGDGRPTDVERGPVTWSNELVLHVVEFKTTEPSATLAGLAARFADEVRHANALMAERGGALLPTAMHPLMQPARAMRLWPHDYQDVYAAYDRIFGCQGHGWSNLQSVHLNLPFHGDEEFARLHAAVRLVLPLIPALAASSPLVEGRWTGLMDTRLEVYRHNARRIPSVAGSVIPESIDSEQEYRERILAPMYRDIAPYDPQGILQHEWLNSRGAIARFDRHTIEIRLIDSQEGPSADLAACRAIAETVRLLTLERWQPLARQRQYTVEQLDGVLRKTTRDAESAELADGEFLAAFGLSPERTYSAGAVWHALLDEVRRDDASAAEWESSDRAYREHGTLARRIAAAIGRDATPPSIGDVYDTLTRCLSNDETFLPHIPEGSSRRVG